MRTQPDTVYLPSKDVIVSKKDIVPYQVREKTDLMATESARGYWYSNFHPSCSCLENDI